MCVMPRLEFGYKTYITDVAQLGKKKCKEPNSRHKSSSNAPSKSNIFFYVNLNLNAKHFTLESSPWPSSPPSIAFILHLHPVPKRDSLVCTTNRKLLQLDPCFDDVDGIDDKPRHCAYGGTQSGGKGRVRGRGRGGLGLMVSAA